MSDSLRLERGRYASSYRSDEIRKLAEWVKAGASGSIVGLAGSGKSNLIFVLGEEPSRLVQYLGPGGPSVAVISVDLNNLADDKVATLYRLILRAMFEAKNQFDPALQTLIATQYEAHKLSIDPFITQNAVRDLMQQCRERQMRLVFLFDQFDTFCQLATRAMTNSLRGLRDGFKAHVCYIVGVRQPLGSMPKQEVLGELYELLDLHTLWLGPMTVVDCRQMILLESHTASKQLTEGEINALIRLSGGFPSLIKAACQWQISLANPVPVAEWKSVLLQEMSLLHRLQEIWDGLEKDEQQILISLVQRRTVPDASTYAVWGRLERKGVCRPQKQGWRIVGELLHGYLALTILPRKGFLWFDEVTGHIYQGDKLLKDISPLEYAVLNFLLQNPFVRHTKTEIINNAWPKEMRGLGVTDDSLYQVVSGLRRKIEVNPSQPGYLATWRGRPEGGYQLYPEGKPPRSE